MDGVSKLGSDKEDEQEYIYKEMDIGAEVMLNKEEADGGIKDAKDDKSCTGFKTQESGWPGGAISFEPPSGQVGGMSSSVEVMVSLEEGGQCDGLPQGVDDGLRGDQAGGEGVPEIIR